MGQELFHQFYSKQFGPRWEALRLSLEVPERQIFRYNQFLQKTRGHGDFQNGVGEWIQSDRRTPERDESGLLDGYVMDPASWWAATALGVQEGHDVLDLCAAPGGKSLILAEQMGTTGSLIANETSEGRRERLMGVIRQYIPMDIRMKIRVTGKDGARVGMQMPQSFDRILVDAPCSGERHLLQNSKELALWTKRRSEGLAAKQYALLCSALLALRSGGRMVYSTCALSPIENLNVVQKLLKKKPDLRLVSGVLPEGAEALEHGIQFFPDRCGFGPLYFAVFERL